MRDFDNWRAKSREFKCGTEPLYIPNLGEYVEKNICVSPFIRAEVYYRIVVTYLHRLCMQVLIIVLQKVLLQVSACLVFKIHTQDLILSSSLETEPLLADIWYIPHLCRSRVPWKWKVPLAPRVLVGQSREVKVLWVPSWEIFGALDESWSRFERRCCSNLSPPLPIKHKKYFCTSYFIRS